MKKLIVLAAAVVLLGAGCAQQVPQAEAPEKDTAEVSDIKEKQQVMVTNVFEHPKFKFTFLIPLGVEGKEDAQGNINFVDVLSDEVFATMIVQPGIPGIALAPNKVEKIKVDGEPGHLYHDTDAKTGKIAIDKLIVDMPKSIQTVFISQPVANAAKFDIKEIVKTWNWK